ncbi:MAG: hypothetical protein FJ267_13975, partial [Planctomycetes bacterium]|nr:hypothetical protein [Planctomycetota bacterium]
MFASSKHFSISRFNLGLHIGGVLVALTLAAVCYYLAIVPLSHRQNVLKGRINELQSLVDK